MADQVLYSGVSCITDLMVKEGLINLDFADVRAVMRGMGKAMMGTGEASGEDRARHAAEAAIANPLLDDVSMQGARGLLISITGGPDLTLYEVDEAASRIREEVDPDANIILGATYDPEMSGTIRVAVVATGTDATMVQALEPMKANASRAPLGRASRASLTPEPAPQPQPTRPAREAEVRRPSPRRSTASRARLLDLSRQDDGVTVEPYIPAADVARRSRKPVRAPRRRFPASTCRPMPSVPMVSAGCRGRRSFPAVARRSLAAEERHDRRAPECPRFVQAAGLKCGPGPPSSSTGRARR